MPAVSAVFLAPVRVAVPVMVMMVFVAVSFVFAFRAVRVIPVVGVPVPRAVGGGGVPGVGMAVRVRMPALHGLLRTAEEPPRLRGIELVRDFRARDEAEGNVREVMGVHDRIHDQPVDREGDVDEAVLHHGGPVLVAEGVAELHAAFNELLGRQFPQIAQIDDEHVAQIDVADHGPVFAVVPEQYVAVAQEGVAIQRNGYGEISLRYMFQETLFLLRSLFFCASHWLSSSKSISASASRSFHASSLMLPSTVSTMCIRFLP